MAMSNFSPKPYEIEAMGSSPEKDPRNVWKTPPNSAAAAAADDDDDDDDEFVWKYVCSRLLNLISIFFI